MKSRSVKRRAASAVVVPLPTEIHPVRRGNHALAAPLIVPACLDEAVNRARASMSKVGYTTEAFAPRETSLAGCGVF